MRILYDFKEVVVECDYQRLKVWQKNLRESGKFASCMLIINVTIIKSSKEK